MSQPVFLETIMNFNNPTWARRHEKTLNDFIPMYVQFLIQRQISKKSLENRQAILNRLSNELGDRGLMTISPKMLEIFISGYEERGTISAAQTAHMVVADLFREAWIDGYVTYSPALPLRYPKSNIKRSRLSAPDWVEMLEHAQKMKRSYLPHAMRIAVITAQRRGDIAALRRDDIWEDHLHIKQQKTGYMLALPLKLKCPLSGEELGDVLESCPGTDFILGKQQVKPYSLSNAFKLARNSLFPDRWRNPPTFHEQRSLSARLHGPSGLDIQRLMGHKFPEETRKYSFNRGLDWNYLTL